MKPLIDSHCHIAHIDRPASDVMADARAAGIEVVIDIGMGLEESRAAADRARNADGLYASVGFHPNDLAGYEADPATSMTKLRELATLPKVVGVGETGLDLYRERSSPAVQEAAFRAHIALAKDTDRTLVIHCRDAHDRLLEVLDDTGPPQRVVMHCFSGDVSFARTCAQRGYFCSFAGNLTYKRSDDLREAARTVPDELLLVETDAPFLTPQPHRGKPNEPAYVRFVADEIARVKAMPVDEVIRASGENAARVFGWTTRIVGTP